MCAKGQDLERQQLFLYEIADETSTLICKGAKWMSARKYKHSHTCKLALKRTRGRRKTIGAVHGFLRFHCDISQSFLGCQFAELRPCRP